MPITMRDLDALESEIMASHGGLYALNEELGIDSDVISRIMEYHCGLFFDKFAIPPYAVQETIIVINTIALGAFELGFRLGRRRR